MLRRLVLLACLLLAMGSAASAAPDTVVSGSKKFSESELLAEIGAILMEEKAGLKVERRMGLGGTILCFEALQTGNLDVYPEYTGTGLVEILKESSPGDSAATYQRLRAEFEKRWQLRWLKPIGFNNTYTLAMLDSRAQALGIRTISDLARHQHDLKFASSHEFLNREDGWIGLKKVYGFDLSQITGMEHGLLYEALRNGRIDVTEVYSTDGKIPAYHLRLLEDDKTFFPPYDACFVARVDSLSAHAGMEQALEALSGQIDNATMQQLNNEVEQQGMSVHSVAVNFLVSHKLITPRPDELETRGTTFWEVMRNRRQKTLELVWQHISLTAIAVIFASLLGIPLGIAIARYRPAAEPTMGAIGVIQTVPSMALLAFMIPVLGLGFKPAVAALFLYALLPIVRNTYTGIISVDPNLTEAAAGLGLSPSQTLRLIEIPLAMPMIMAGVRTSVVISIGTATLAAFIGAGGLGEPIVTGLTLNDSNLILSGAVPAAILAVVVDYLLGLAQKFASPRGLRR